MACCGPNVTAVLLAGEGVQIFGCHALGGHGSVLRRTEPLVLAAPPEAAEGAENHEAHEPAKLAFGAEHVAIVTRGGRLYTGGRNGHGQTAHELLCAGPTRRSAGRPPILAPRLPGIRVTDVACGRFHTLIAGFGAGSASGSADTFGDGGWGVWGAGDNEHSQLARGGDAYCRFVPLDLAELRRAARARAGPGAMPRGHAPQAGAPEAHPQRLRIAAGATHSVVAWGSVVATAGKEQARLGIGARPRNAGGGLNILSEAWPGARLVDLAAGGGHTAVGVVLDGRYGVYSWGENEWGQLGVGGFTAQHVPTRLPCDFGELPRHFSSMLAAGAENTIVMVQGSVWTCGYSAGGPHFSATLRRLEQSVFGGASVACVSAGEQHSAFVTLQGDLYMCGTQNPGPHRLDNHQLDNGIPTAVRRVRGSCHGICGDWALAAPTLVPPEVFGGRRVGHWFLSAATKLALAMGTHTRLGSRSAGARCPFQDMPGHLLRAIVEDAEQPAPESSA